MALVYSYVRFSSKRQAEGDSLRRQTEDGDDWIAANGHTKADLSLQDLGVSAFRGANKHKGALKTFLDLAKEGRIPKGSILLIEALDRLSRQGIREANHLFQEILETGVKIAVLKPTPTVYDESSLDDPIGTLIPLISFYLASLESKNKSFRIKKDREQKRKESLADQAPIKTKSGEIEKMSPAWISWNENKQRFDVNEGAAAIRFIFQQVAKGKGQPTILRELQEQFPPIGRSGKWNSSYLTKVLNDVAVLGLRQHYEFIEVDKERKRVPVGEPIPGYYPKVISQELWDRVQATRPGQKPRGRTASVLNLFKGLIVNAHDGHSMHLQRAARPDGTCDYRLVSYGHIRKIKECDSVGVPYFQFEGVFLKYLSEVSLQDLAAPSTDDSTLPEKEQQLSGVRKRLLELQELLADPDGRPPKTLLAAAQATEARERALIEEIEQLRAQGAGGVPLMEAQSLVAAASDTANREKLASVISRLVKRIHLKPEKHYGRVWWAALIEFHPGLYRQIHCTPFGFSGTNEQLPLDNEGWCGAGYSVDLTNPESARSKQIFATFARLFLQPVELPDSIPDDLLGASEYYLLQQKGTMRKESFKTLPARIRRFVEVIGHIPCADITPKSWARYVRLLPRELGRSTARGTLNSVKRFCRWLVANGKMQDFPALSKSAAQTLP